MRLLLLLAFVLAVVAVIVALVGHNIFGLTIGVSGWIAAALAAFFLDALLGSPTVKLR